MGVQGLTSWVDQHSTLCEYHELSSDDARAGDNAGSAIPFIIDGLPRLHFVSVPPQQPRRRGSDTRRQLSRAASDPQRVHRILPGRGLEPEVVWDGPYGSNKTETILSRGRQAIRSSHEFMRSSDDKRAQVHVISKAARLPLLARSACTYELHRLNVSMHSAQAEADSPTAELAQRRNGYAVSQARGGYVPLDRIEYGPERLARPRPGMLRPGSRAVLRIGVYQPARVAQMLGFHLDRLPVFAALAGNDLANLTQIVQLASNKQHSRSRPSRRIDIDKMAGIIVSIGPT
ncbi:BQ2448_3135 [Microbotryum intermedium]|uniref:BQ2448_3135 protein n=1 Tax=Microbotryum intermedium TaxID=269621 RepID=A0A238FEC0_9BASI|nr:BQ2448_3135 [Microbotryum intermedium]